MKRPLILFSPLVALLVASSARAADWYVSPTGTATCNCTTRATPCDLATAASTAVAGDNVILLDGVYKTSLNVANSGTASAWITFKADACATPIIEGSGAGPMDDVQDSGVHSDTAEYVRFDGLVARGWNIGFGNGWAGGTTSSAISNGNWEIKNCISYSNGRTGFTFFSAGGFHLINSISAHNGSSQVHSWSSGVTLFEGQGTDNLIQGVVSFENTDAEKNTDGSGFIVDEQSNNGTLLNNIAFGNSGSCFRLTKSSGTKFINNTCYHNSQFGSAAMGPTNPGELYFTNGGVTVQGVTVKSNVIVGTGQAPAGSTPIQNQPTTGWSNNVVATGTVTYFTAADGTNPDFTPVSAATTLIGKGSSGGGAPTNDIGFDPKCLVRRTPIMTGMVASVATWKYDVDIDYIKSLGGVAGCFNAGARAATPDIGAYKSGAVTKVTPGACVPSGSTGGTACAGSTGGTAGATGPGDAGSGGTNGTNGASTTGGASTSGTNTTSGASTSGTNTTGGASTSGTNTTGGASSGGTNATGGGAATSGTGAATATAGASGNTVTTSTGGATTSSDSSGAATAGTAGVATGSGNTGTTTTGTGGSSSSASHGTAATGAGGVTVGSDTGTVGGATAGSTAGAGSSAGAASEPSGCGCRIAPHACRVQWLASLGLVGLALLGRRRRGRAGRN